MDGPVIDPGLYDRDFHAWALDQAERLRVLSASRSNVPLDLEHLAEEIGDMGNNELDVVERLLVQVLAHLLKLEHSSEAEPRFHWRSELAAFRDRVARKLGRSPTLRGKVTLLSIHQTARRVAAASLRLRQSDLPEAPPYTIDQILDLDWYPTNRHGLTDEE